DAGRPRSWRGVLVCVALFLVSIVWMIVAVQDKANYDGWAGGGGLLFLASAVGFIICLVVSGNSAARGPTADGGLIVSPLGIALQQGRLCGQMRWDEVTEIERRPPGDEVRIHFEG